MELIPNARVSDGLLATMTLLSEKPHQGVPSWESAPHQGIGFVISSTAMDFQFRCSGIMSGTVVAPCKGNNVGLTFGGTAEGGLGPGVSLSAQLSAYAGIHYNPNSGGFSLGAAGTVGGIGPGPVGQGNSSQGWVLGAALQGGFGFTFGNAGSVQSLTGKSTTYSADIRFMLGPIPIGIGGSYSRSADGIWQTTINPPITKGGWSLHASKVQSYTPSKLTFGKGC